jgi:integrase
VTTVGSLEQAPDAAGYPQGLRGKLMAAVRPEFRAPVLRIDPADPVFGAVPCLVAGCGRAARLHELCSGHFQRWNMVGRPDKLQFIQATAALMRGNSPLRPCMTPGCGYGRNSTGLCVAHIRAWQRAGSPGRAAWLASLSPVSATAPHGTCRIATCSLWATARTPLCASHAAAWRNADRPDITAFADAYQNMPPWCETIDLVRLPPLLRLELQYALQQRSDQQQARLIPKLVRHSVNVLVELELRSLLQWPEELWHERVLSPLVGRKASGPFLDYARRQVEQLCYGAGWEIEYPRDVWRLRNLALEGNRATIRFDQIPQPRIRELSKRWARWRIAGGVSIEHVATGVSAVDRFAQFLGGLDPAIEAPAGIDRNVLERYLADLRPLGATHHHVRLISSLGIFFQDIRRHRWDPDLPADAVFFAEDYPRQAERLPRALAENVMAQVEDPANLDRWDDPVYRLITVILMRCGLRSKDATRLPYDCLVRDSDGAPYLRYTNHKMKREALVPIDEELEADIRDQQRRLREHWPEQPPVLFPRKLKNLHGTEPMSTGTYRQALYPWLVRCDVRDENGDPAHLTPHQWRHTLGTRLINRDVPQEVVRKILDHDSHEMTAHYARIHDSTVRRHWERARKVNITGNQVSLDPDGPLAEAAWAKQRVSRATQALPNGYCALPVVKSCPHANACLTCPMFITTAEFLPQHRQQRSQILQIISAAQARGQQRVQEMNQHVLDSLDNVITALEHEDEDTTEGISHAC